VASHDAIGRKLAPLGRFGDILRRIGAIRPAVKSRLATAAGTMSAVQGEL